MEFLNRPSRQFTFSLCLHLLLGLALSHESANAITQDGETVDPKREALVEEQAKHLCASTDEYIKTLKFLRATKEIVLPERTARMVAEKVARGCNGASERFVAVLRLLKTLGLSDPKSLEMALEFSAHPPDVQKNFSTILSRAFLSEFFDYEYPVAMALAYELSRDYAGDPALAREDFIALTDFCKNNKDLDLTVRTCAEFAVKMARRSQYFPHGLREPFTALFQKLRDGKEFGLDVRAALEMSYNVLKFGPRAPDNFLSAYSYAIKQDGLALGRNQAMAFALRMAARSFEGTEPPAIPGVDRAAEK